MKKKLACFTLDFEWDYGGRLGTHLKTIAQTPRVQALADFLYTEKVPLSIFLQTSLLKEAPQSLEVLNLLGSEFHSHSHTHALTQFKSESELSQSLHLIRETFSQEEVGYRAPLGCLYPGDLELIQNLGYAFDSSIFPSYRPGKFNHLKAPIEPYWHECGLLELPFAVIPKIRLILGLTYMRLLGYTAMQSLMKIFSLPDVVVFYGHLTDYIPTEDLDSLPFPFRNLFRRNADRGLEFAQLFARYLKSQGYTFVTMNELAASVKA
ncbi:MAG: DUF3473 domain-containing protein [Planctomycetes bacterium]|nr:DUF3473 domain-containing protein [Planctomycetota bacterium]